MTKYYKTKPPSSSSKPVGVRTKAYVKKAHGVSRIVRDTYGKPSDWWELGKKVRARDNGKCLFCKTPEDPKNNVYHDLHHIKRLADGGTTSLANLCLCCAKCHKKRPGHSHMR